MGIAWRLHPGVEEMSVERVGRTAETTHDSRICPRLGIRKRISDRRYGLMPQAFLIRYRESQVSEL